MSHWQADVDDDDDEADDGEDWVEDGDRLKAAEMPDPSDTDGPADGDEAVDPCPFCGRAVYEFADQCPGCRNFLGGSDDPTVVPGPVWRRRPLWFTARRDPGPARRVRTHLWRR